MITEITSSKALKMFYRSKFQFISTGLNNQLFHTCLFSEYVTQSCTFLEFCFCQKSKQRKNEWRNNFSYLSNHAPSASKLVVLSAFLLQSTLLFSSVQPLFSLPFLLLATLFCNHVVLLLFFASGKGASFRYMALLLKCTLLVLQSRRSGFGISCGIGLSVLQSQAFFLKTSVSGTPFWTSFFLFETAFFL